MIHVAQDNFYFNQFKWLCIWMSISINLIVPFHKDFSSSSEQLEHHKLAHEL